MSEKDSRPLFALLFAALAVTARLPFLTSGKIPFDSDEAVEGLMARHVLAGEFPAFFWGQAFKGVPEVYAAAGAFALFGSSVAVLKGVTLAFFAAYVALNFIVLDKVASRSLAIAASLLLIFAPPALVFWSLDASAEYIVIMLLGTMLLFLCLRLEESARAKSNRLRLPPFRQATASLAEARSAEAEEPGAKGLLLAIGLVCGLGLWVHQLFVVYLLPVALILMLQSDWWQQRTFSRPNALAVALGAVAAAYLGFGLLAFFTGGFSLRMGPIAISATAPQKMLRIAVAIAALALAIHSLPTVTREQAAGFIRRYWAFLIGLLTGYLPVLLYSIVVEPARPPARNANLRQLLNAAPDIFGNVVPILGGFKIATTERLPLPPIAVIPGIAALAAYLWANRMRLGRVLTLSARDASWGGDFFPLFVVFVPALFLISGAYVDTQSYRYLIPWYAGLAVAWAGGSVALARQMHAKFFAAILVGAIIAVHTWQQVIWYQKLEPDTQSVALIDCMKREGIRGGYAEYWTSYRLTFIAQENIVIAPTGGIDRYPRYTEYVRSLPSNERIDDAARCN